MRASIRSVAEMAEAQDTGAARTTDAVERILGAIEETGGEIVKADAIAKKTLRDGAAGSDAVVKTTASMHQMAQVVRTTVDAVRKFGARSSDIREIVAVIDDITEQTNLLALNASINRRASPASTAGASRSSPTRSASWPTARRPPPARSAR